jgi:hypothetical protein
MEPGHHIDHELGCKTMWMVIDTARVEIVLYQILSQYPGVEPRARAINWKILGGTSECLEHSL